MAKRRAPVGRLVDLAVAVPTSTFVAARRAVPLAARIGTLGAARVIARVSEAVHELRQGDTPIDSAAESLPAAATDTGSDGAAGDAASSISPDELPIDGYDDLAARQVVDRLGDMERADLARIEIYEREHRNRSTVLGKISMLNA